MGVPEPDDDVLGDPTGGEDGGPDDGTLLVVALWPFVVAAWLLEVPPWEEAGEFDMEVDTELEEGGCRT